MKKLTVNCILALFFQFSFLNIFSQTLAVPTPLAPTSYGYILNWTAISGATGYNVFVQNPEGSIHNEYVVSGGSTTSMGWCQIETNGNIYPFNTTETYTFFVQAYNSTTTSIMSTGYSFHFSLPPTPTGVAVSPTPVTPASVITWTDPSADPNTDYDLQLTDVTTGTIYSKWIGEQTSSPNMNIASLMSQTGNVNLVAGHSYNISVYAHMKAITGADNNICLGVLMSGQYPYNNIPGKTSNFTLSCPTLANPIITLPSPITTNSTISWSSPNATNYNIAFADLTVNPNPPTPTFNPAIGGFTSTSNTSYSPIGSYINSPVIGHTYKVWIQASNECSIASLSSTTFVLYAAPLINNQTVFNFAAAVGTNSGSGVITASSGQTVTVTISGSGGVFPTLQGTTSIALTGVTLSGGTNSMSVTNGSKSQTFVMPSNGSISWSGTFSQSRVSGSGSISVQ